MDKQLKVQVQKTSVVISIVAAIALGVSRSGSVYEWLNQSSASEATTAAIASKQTLLDELQAVRQAALANRADTLLPELWKGAEEMLEKFAKITESAEFATHFDKAKRAFTICSEQAVDFAQMQDCEANFIMAQISYRRGYPDPVALEAQGIASAHRVAEEFKLKSQFKMAANKFKAASTLLITLDKQQRIAQAERLVESDDHRSAYKLLIPAAIGESSVADQLFDQLIASNSEYWLDQAIESIEQFQQSDPDEFLHSRPQLSISLLTAYARLGLKEPLEALIEKCFGEFPDVDAPVFPEYLRALAAAISATNRTDLASRLMVRLREFEKLPQAHFATASWILNRPMDFEKSVVRKMDEPATVSRDLADMVILSVEDASILQHFAARYKTQLSLSQKLSIDAKIAASGGKQLVLDLDNLEKELDELTIEDCTHLQQLAYLTNNDSYTQIAVEAIRKKSKEQLSPEVEKRQSTLTCYLSLVANSTPSNALATLRARCAQSECYSLDRIASDRIAEVLNCKKCLAPHEINMVLVGTPVVSRVDILCSLATANRTNKPFGSIKSLVGHKFKLRIKSANEDKQELDVIFRGSFRSSNEVEAWFHDSDQDHWQLAIGTVEGNGVRINPVVQSSPDARILDAELLLHVENNSLMGIAIAGEAIYGCILIDPVKVESKSEIAEFELAINSAAFQGMIAKDDRNQIQKWYWNYPLVYLVKAEAKMADSESESGNGPTKYSTLIDASAKKLGKLVPGFDPKLERLSGGKGKSQAHKIGFYFAPQINHKSFAASDGFGDDPLANSRYAVFARHPLNDSRELRHVLICIDPSGLTPNQLAPLIDAALLRALGVGLYSPPPTYIHSVLLPSKKDRSLGYEVSELGLTPLDRRMLRALYSAESFEKSYPRPLPVAEK